MIVRRHHLHLLRVRTKNTNHQIVADPVRTEDAKRIGVGSVEQGRDFVWIDGVDGK
jgi:hypothetical protein